MIAVLEKLTFKARILALISVFLIAICAISCISVLNLKDQIMEERESKTQGIMDVAFGVLSYYQGMVATGKMDEDAAKRTAIAQLRVLRYGKGASFLVVDTAGTFLLNPGFEELEGKSRLDLADANGKPATRSLIETGRAGGGFNSYWFAREKGSAPVEQVTYSREFVPWNWVVGTSMVIDDVNHDLFQQTVRLACISAVMLLAVLVAGLAIHRSLAATLGAEPSEAAIIARELAQGNLAVGVEVDPRDQSSLIFSVQQVKLGLLCAILKIQTASTAIATATRQIAVGNNDLSARTETQAASLEETAASISQMTEAVRQNADSARQASVLAAEADEIAGTGDQKVRELVRTIGHIEKSSSRISEITALIDDIAFQTNILALNAAVEAARAGELGRGFAVVANEVRSLAQKSATSAKEIKELVVSSVDLVSSCVGEAVAARTTMATLKETIARVSTIVAEIAVASDEQSHSIQQVNRAVAHMDNATQQNAALVEEAAAAAASLSDQATELQHAVGVFKTEAAD